MEFSDTWTCGCGAFNTGDVFSGACWKCGSDWKTGPVKIQTAEELNICPDCRATDGFHKMSCQTHPFPKELFKK